MIEESTNLPTLKRVNKFSFKSGMNLPKVLKKSFQSFKHCTLLAIAIFSFAFSPSLIQAQPDGKKLFQPCSACHKTSDKKLIGPGLKGASERLDMEWLIPWVRNSAEVIKSGDAYANQIFKEYGGVAMTANP